MSIEEIQKLADEKYPKNCNVNRIANPAFVIGGLSVDNQWSKKDAVAQRTVAILSKIVYDQHMGKELDDDQRQFLEICLKKHSESL